MKITDKSVRDCPVTVQLTEGKIQVENKINGVLFTFPAACWPCHWNLATNQKTQMDWITRLTPWWDAPEWTPRAQRLRESCVKAINQILAHDQI